MRAALLLACATTALFASQVEAAGQRNAAGQLPAPKVVSLPSMGRLTFPAAGKAGYVATQAEDRLVITHAQGGRVGVAPRLPRNAVGMTSDATTIELRLAPGTRVQTRVVGAGLVVDLLDPPATVRVDGVAAAIVPDPVAIPVPDPQPAAAPDAAPRAEAAGAAAPVQPVSAEPLRADSAQPAAERPAGERSGAEPGNRTRNATDLRVPAVSPAPAQAPAPAVLQPVAGSTAALLPVPRSVGAAAFRSGADLVVVLDAPIPITAQGAGLAAAFPRMTSQVTEDAAVLRLVQAPASMHLVRDPHGWVITAEPEDAETGGIAPRLVESPSGAVSLRLPASAPSRVVSLVERDTGAHLLVGTQTQAGEAVLDERQQVQFNLLTTRQGVVVVAKSDNILLRREPDGFAIVAGPHADNTILSSEERQAANAPPVPPLSRLFGIPADSVPNLSRRLDKQTLDAGNTPGLARGEPRLALAETMVALGLGSEAQTVLDVAVTDDPALRDRPRAIGLRAVAAMLAHRHGEAGALMDKRLDGTAEIELWRGLLHAATNQATPQDAKRIAAGLPVLLAYPLPLRDRLLPRALETMALNDRAPAAAAALETLPAVPALDLTRGMVLEATGQADAALKVYAALAEVPDRMARYRAGIRSVELRLKGGAIDAAQAADALDRSLFGWRAPQQELELRFRIARLRAQAGQWREALNVLREGRAAFPDEVRTIDREMAATFDALLTGAGVKAMPPAEFVKLFDQNVDVIGAMSWTERNGLPLVERLTALGLQARAESVLMQILSTASDPVRRTVLGARLAILRVGTGNAAGAIQALSDTVPPPGTAMDPAFVTARQLTYARAEAALGHRDVAVRMLGAIGTAEADEARADLHSAASAWPQAVKALTDLEAKRIGPALPEAGLTPEQQALVLRLAVASTLADDGPTRIRVAATYGAAMEKTQSASMFRLMTSAPVKGTGDLPRAFDEIKLAQRVKGQIGKEVRP